MAGGMLPLNEPLDMEGRAALLPFRDTLPGSVMNERSWALPGMLAGAWNAFTAPGRAARGMLDPSSPQAMEEALNVAGYPMLASAPLAAARPSLPGMLGVNVFHGSPHKFDRFDAAHIGKGEGAQAYGHGLYFAENPSVAQAYRDNLLDSPNVRRTASFDPATATWTRNQTGALYKVDLPDEMAAKMLDWDKPLSQQPKVREALLKSDHPGIEQAVAANYTGQQIAELLANRSGVRWEGAAQREASDILRSLGIPGIRYLDQGSRTAGKGTSNYVVFPGEEAALKILERNGTPLPGMLGVNVFHGSPRRGLKLNDLHPRRAVETEGAVFFTDNPDVANIFRYPREYGEVLFDQPRGSLVKANVNFKNPMELRGADAQRFTDDTVFQGEVVRSAKAKGHDGIIVRDVKEGVGDVTERGTTYVAFDPSTYRAAGGEAKARMAALAPEIKRLGEKGGLTREEAAVFQRLTNEYHAAQYDTGLTAGKPIDVAPAEIRQSTLAPQTNNALRADVIRDKEVFLALSEASAGTYNNALTAIDKILLGQNPRVSPQQLYDAFAASREALRAQYGDRITLYRAQGRQMAKPTTNWATTEAFAEQFGNNVISREIPVENILAANVSKNGKYHELIVGAPPKVGQ